MLMDEEDRVKDSWRQKTKADYHTALIARGLYQLRHQLAAMFKDPHWPELTLEDFLIKFDIESQPSKALPPVTAKKTKSANEPNWMQGLKKKEVNSRAAWAMWTGIDMATGKQAATEGKKLKRKR